MRYQSSRSKGILVTASQAILQGLAPDGGLFLPEALPRPDFASWQNDSYQTLAEKIFSIFLSDFDDQAIQGLVARSYGSNFQDPEITPLHRLDQGTSVLELWHGPTLAFKDLALQALPHLFREAKKIQGLEEDFLILTATSGDTGKAAMAGFAGVSGSTLAVFYPDGGVSQIQERQMLMPGPPNVAAFAMEGNFDDCQRVVKALMQDQTFIADMARQGVRLTSANSINIGRLIPQMVYYLYAYFRTVKAYGDPLSLVVPSGNAGNILAARYVKAMGLPLARIRLASNENKVLYDFLTSGHYDARRSLVKTSSPSMDILIASNLERYLHLLTGDEALILDLMEELKVHGHFSFDPQLLDLDASWVNEDQVGDTIRRVYQDYAYLLDPHTAVAARAAFDADDPGPRLIVSTASPYKFADSVLEALGPDLTEAGQDPLDKIQALLGTPLPPGIQELKEKRPLARRRIQPWQAQEAVKALLGVKNDET